VNKGDIPLRKRGEIRISDPLLKLQRIGAIRDLGPRSVVRHWRMTPNNLRSAPNAPHPSWWVRHPILERNHPKRCVLAPRRPRKPSICPWMTKKIKAATTTCLLV